MPILSPKRQVTLPKELCDRLHVAPGDDLTILEHQGRITIVKKTKGRSAGVLKHLAGAGEISDEESLLDAVTSRGGRHAS
jgi:AbrB family looped-hinge helix DNA binding protein